MKIFSHVVLVFFIFLTFLSSVHASYKASIAQMVVYAENRDKGVLIDFVKALEKYSNKKISYVVVPFKRSLENVIMRKVHFHMPLIALPPQKAKKLNFDYSTETIFHVNFVIFFNKSKNVTKNNYHKFKVETDFAHIEFFDKSVKSSTNIEGSLKKVNSGRIDAFIFADNATYPFIKKNNLKNIKSSLYERFDVKIILPKGERGKEVDNFLSETIKKMRRSGEFNKIMDKIDLPYKNLDIISP